MSTRVKKFSDDSKVFVAGHKGLIGSAVVRALREEGFHNLVVRDRSQLDLIDQRAVNDFFKSEQPPIVILAAAKVGGILSNRDSQADFIYQNLMMQCNVIHAAANYGCEKLVFLGSTCVYPRLAPQPIPESSLLTGPLEPTNEGYAIAKIAGIKLCEHMFRQYGKNFVSAMPCNAYGPGDNYHPSQSHVIPALLRRVHDAKRRDLPEVVVWGTGSPKREFLYSEDIARAIVTIMLEYDSPELINIGSGTEVTIKEAAELICQTVGYTGKLIFDSSMPDGTPRKVTNASKVMSLGWTPKISLLDGLNIAYRWAVDNQAI